MAYLPEPGTPATSSSGSHVHPAEPVRVARTEFRDLLRRVGREVDRGEADVDRAVRGAHGGLDMGELIALQARIYRYTESIELCAKLVDRASSAVKTILQGQ